MNRDSVMLRRWLASGAQAVKRSREKLDAINVFPVADSDTGTNLYLTLAEGNKAVAKLADSATHREVVAAFARGCLVGARGNSGVIVSQYLGGFLKSIDAHGGLENATPQGIADALETASESAYASVGKPVEGTILSVARAAARGAQQAVDANAQVQTVAIAAVVAARAELSRTYEILPEANDAGVVDAGAAGLMLQLEMLAETIAGKDALSAIDEVEWEISAHVKSAVASADAHHHGDGGAYEVMFLVESSSPGTDLAPQLKRALDKVGDSVTVVGDKGSDDTVGAWQAHVHTDRPADAIAVSGLGLSSQVIVRHIENTYAGDRASTGVVVLTSCPGLAADLAHSGAVVLVDPTAEAISPASVARAFEDASGMRVVAVAGTRTLKAAAQHFADETEEASVEVIDSFTEPQLIAAVAAHAMLAPGEDPAAAMNNAAHACATSRTTVDALVADVTALVTANTELVTLVLGRGVNPAVAEAAESAIATRAPHAEVQVFEGGQESPPILIGVE